MTENHTKFEKWGSWTINNRPTKCDLWDYVSQSSPLRTNIFVKIKFMALRLFDCPQNRPRHLWSQELAFFSETTSFALSGAKSSNLFRTKLYWGGCPAFGGHSHTKLIYIHESLLGDQSHTYCVTQMHIYPWVSNVYSLLPKIPTKRPCSKAYCLLTYNTDIVRTSNL